MTFSIAGHCARTGMVGVAITTSSICVGARCPHARAGVGAVATQNITDPNLATLVLDRLEAGESAGQAIAAVVEDRANIDYRQLTAVDHNGGIGHFTGGNILGTNAVSEGDNCVAAGNLLRDDWESIWDSRLFHEFRDRELDPAASGLPEMCWECPDLPLCGGGCRIERDAQAGVRVAGGCSSAGCSSAGCGGSSSANRKEPKVFNLALPATARRGSGVFTDG